MDRKIVAAGLYEGLARADLDYRRKQRGTFRKVDRIKRAPGWLPWWKRPIRGRS